MISKKIFGRTGHYSSRTIFGAVALANLNQNAADKTLDLLLKYGVNHIDTAMDYGDAELRVGPWMRQHKADFFLATKTSKRTYRDALADLYKSLKRLRVEQIDLWQMHALIDPAEWEVAMGEGGALEAFIEAKEKGLVKYLGVTGHGYTIPKMHLKSLEKYDFDSVLLPYNYFMINNTQYASDFNKLNGFCISKKVAVQTIKTITKGSWKSDNKKYSTWYEPLTDPTEIEAAMFYSMNNPDIFINTVGDIELLPFVLEAADNYENKKEKYLPENILKKIKFNSLF
ncbi:MAG: aldo/keto reductase [Bacteroidetes bacterium]|nr:aldo/keto reductase [Bacteroidota bacterium]